MLKLNKEILMEIFEKSIQSVQPYNLIKNNVEVKGRHLRIKDQNYEIRKPVHIIGFGKAVLGMAIALEQTLGNQLQRGIVSIPHGILSAKFENSKIEFYEGALHNLPDENALKTSVKIKKYAQSLDEDDTVIVLISGGGSALLPLPKGKITLEEKFKLVKKLGNLGANINEINTVRKQISELKGGGLAQLCHPARVISLILSDVIGDPLDVIASGPTCQNLDDVESAINVLKKYSLYENLTPSIKKVLNISRKEPFDLRVDNFILGNNEIALDAALGKSEELGLRSMIISTKICGDVEELSVKYEKLTQFFLNRDIENLKKFLKLNFELHNENSLMKSLDEVEENETICLLFGGEPTVLVSGNGTGGRNQQLALSFSLKLSELNGNVFFLSCGTDGIDGPTDAAGAIGYSTLRKDCQNDKITPEIFLENNDSYNFFKKFKNGECLVKIGNTGTNVMDIHIILIRI